MGVLAGAVPAGKEAVAEGAYGAPEGHKGCGEADGAFAEGACGASPEDAVGDGECEDEHCGGSEGDEARPAEEGCDRCGSDHCPPEERDESGRYVVATG